MPHTLRCTGNEDALQFIGKKLKSLKTAYVSLLDCTVQNVSSLQGSLLEGVALHGLVVSSGELREIAPGAFRGLAAPLQALGLPNNRLTAVPTAALENLPELDRLDLSGNRMKAVDADAFKGLHNLSFIELSDNALTRISPNAFGSARQLRVLRLRGNRLTLPTITGLVGLNTVEELDLSLNSLIGPLGPKTFPMMGSLNNLQMGYNGLSSLRMGSMKGLGNLTSLLLPHNQIDVLEDNAFINLGNLMVLDLSHNRIVAVSGASLAHLVKLVELNLRHNFLRALTADLVVPLRSLKRLHLDENDISIVASDALKESEILTRLTLAENPLNCDCSLAEFAMWLGNSSLGVDDKGSAVCATPPPLENGLLMNVSLKDLLCGEDEIEAAPVSAPIKDGINLQSFNYDGSNVILQWSVDESAAPYGCDAIFVYEEEGPSEVLLESIPLKCNSTQSPDPRSLTVTVPNSTNLQPGHRYRYCIVLLESESYSDDLSVVLGCSDVLPLVQNVRVLPRTDFSLKSPRVISIQANLSSYGNLAISVNVVPMATCEVNLAVLEQGSLLSQKRVNCSDPKYTYVGLQRGPYRVCANVVPESGNKPRCVTVYKGEPHGGGGITGLDVAFVTVFLILCIMVVALIWGVRKVLLRPKLTTHQCFMPPEFEDEQQHNRYVKLQATTKL